MGGLERRPTRGNPAERELRESTLRLPPSAFCLCSLLAELYKKLGSEISIALSLKISIPAEQSRMEKGKYECKLVLYIWNEHIPRNSI